MSHASLRGVQSVDELVGFEYFEGTGKRHRMPQITRETLNLITDVATIKEAVLNTKSDVTELKEDLTGPKGKIPDIERRLTKLEQLQWKFAGVVVVLAWAGKALFDYAAPAIAHMLKGG